MDDSGAFQAWAAEAIARRWPRARLDQIAALRGDLSTRRFWRVAIATPRNEAPATAILVDLGPDDLPRYVRVLNLLPSPITEHPWLNLHRFLMSIGSPVPALYDADPARRAMLVEDVGELSLLDAVRRPDADAADLFRLAAAELIRFHVDGTAQIDSRCVAHEIAYTGRLFEWELKEFAEVGLAAVSPGADFSLSLIAPELASLAARLDRFPRVFSHRDYHRENLYIQNLSDQNGPRIRIIDFQDALMAPAAQDLAVLLTTRDTDEVITPAIERRILDFYCAGLARRGAPALDAADFITSYRLCVLQHALKMIGRFEMFERNGKTGYRRYIPHVLGQARRMLAEMRPDFPKLREALMP
jgi:aminoglycoside/choline kinase family phosphotransferase